MLTHEGKRAAYDNERWLSGRFKKNAAILTPQYFLDEARKLNRHLSEVDVYRMNKQLLQEYLLFLLSPDKAAIIIQHGAGDMIVAITVEIVKASQYLPVYFAMPVLEKLSSLTATNSEASQLVKIAATRTKKEAKWQKAFPWLIALTTVAILIAMYLFSRKYGTALSGIF